MVAFCENSPIGSTGPDFFCELGHSRIFAPKYKGHDKFGATIYAEVDQLESCSRDPIGFYGSKWNLYRYGSARPLVAADPMGLDDIITLEDCPRRPPPCGSEQEWVRARCGFRCLWPFLRNGGAGLQRIADDAYAAGLACGNSVVPPTDGDPNPIVNQAIRHCTAAAIMRCKIGGKCARCEMNERELFQSKCSGQPCDAMLRAIANNLRGDREDVSCESPCEDCKRLAREGKLDTRPDDPTDDDPTKCNLGDDSEYWHRDGNWW